uniref:Uncharacterized protein n=1 Tax=Chenopodium quinoa TaxID=63459 RepID=A0A803MKC8_CHEQI
MNLPELKRSLYCLFSQFGRILDVVALKTPKLRGIGYNTESNNAPSQTPSRAAAVNSLRTGMMAQFKSSFVAASPDSQNQATNNSNVYANKRPAMTGFVSGGTIGGDTNRPKATPTTNFTPALGGSIGGTNTSSAIIVWAMTLLIKNSAAMKKVQRELRGLAGNKGYVSPDDLPKLEYFKSMINETFRLCLAIPMLIVGETLEKCPIERVPRRSALLFWYCYTVYGSYQNLEFEDGGYGVNYSGNFVTDVLFPTFEDAIKWADAVSINIRFIFVKSSENKTRESQPYRYLKCDRARRSKPGMH